ncbi:formylglycine-generating enzyme family protein [Treponema sp. R80B11-R83G3]
MRKNLFIALSVLTGIAITMAACALGEDVATLEKKAMKANFGTTVSYAEITGVTAPVHEGRPVTTITANDQYTGTVKWSPADTVFRFGVRYTATITLAAKAGYTLQGVEANFFTVSGANKVSNGKNSGVVTATFTAGQQPVWLNSVTANGDVSSMRLTLSFDKAITGLSAADITLSGITGVTKGTLSGTGPSYTLPISGFTGGVTLSVAVAKSGYTISGSPKTVTIYFPVTLNSVTADGSSTQTTTQLTLDFNTAITGLSAADITLSGVTGVTKGTLSGSGPSYTLPISGFYSSGTLSVAVAKSGYTISGSPKTVTIYLYFVTLNSVTADGSSTQTTTQLTLDFNTAITGLSAADITLSGVTGVTKGTLSGSGPSYTLPISGFYSSGTLSVAVAKSGYTISGSPKTVTIYLYFNLGVEMVLIPSGSFQMGQEGVATPVHTVTLSSFYMGKYEVTQEQWTAVMGSNPSYFPSSPASGEVQSKRPVEQVSWYSALVFCNKLSMMEGLSPAYRISGSTDPSAWGTVPTSSNSTWDAVQIVSGSTGYRLPTEAQWEYACRAGTTTAYNTGAAISDNTGWYSSNSGNRTHQVGLKTANAWGLYDMHGNVWEWCWDWYGSYSSSAQTDPVGASSGSDRVVRGGSWGNSAEYVRSGHRGSYDPSSRRDSFGFRLVRP